ncbi:MAG TPA: sugar ABC transporter permease, partial [Thermomicrobiales bacterium]|nr:sugar ABC transporter permease [Thermomicrobiales bacterium]
MAVAQGAAKPIAEQPALVTPLERATRQPIGRLLILPALIYAIVVTQIPFILTVLYSFQRWNLNRPENRGWVGLGNYVYMFTRDPDFYDSLLTTIIFVIGSVGGSLVFGLLFAELVNHRFPGRGIVRTFLITPFLIMPT